MINRPPIWVMGSATIAPGANSVLTTYTPDIGKIAFLFGARIISQEAAAAGKSWQIARLVTNNTQVSPLFELDVNLPVLISDSPIDIMKGQGPPGTVVSDHWNLTNLLAGTAATRHQGGLLILIADYWEVFSFDLQRPIATA